MLKSLLLSPVWFALAVISFFIFCGSVFVTAGLAYAGVHFIGRGEYWFALKGLGTAAVGLLFGYFACMLTLLCLRKVWPIGRFMPTWMHRWLDTEDEHPWLASHPKTCS